MSSALRASGLPGAPSVYAKSVFPAPKTFTVISWGGLDGVTFLELPGQVHIGFWLLRYPLFLSLSLGNCVKTYRARLLCVRFRPSRINVYRIV